MSAKKHYQLYDPVWLQDAYTHATTRQIAKQLGCHPTQVTRALHRLGIPMRPAKRMGPPKLYDAAWLAETYAHHTTHEIAAMLGCGQSSVCKALRRCGIVLRHSGGRLRPIGPDRYGKDSDGRYRRIYRLMIEQQLGRRLTPEEHVHHIDGNHSNNDPANLVVLLKHVHHQTHGKLSEDNVREIRRLIATKVTTQAALARRFGVDPGHISHIVHRRNWQHI